MNGRSKYPRAFFGLCSYGLHESMILLHPLEHGNFLFKMQKDSRQECSCIECQNSVSGSKQSLLTGHFLWQGYNHGLDRLSVKTQKDPDLSPCRPRRGISRDLFDEHTHTITQILLVLPKT